MEKLEIKKYIWFIEIVSACIKISTYLYWNTCLKKAKLLFSPSQVPCFSGSWSQDCTWDCFFLHQIMRDRKILRTRQKVRSVSVSVPSPFWVALSRLWPFIEGHLAWELLYSENRALLSLVHSDWGIQIVPRGHQPPHSTISGKKFPKLPLSFYNYPL